MQDGLSEIQPLVERVAVGNLRGELGEIGRYDATIRRAHRSRRDEERQEADLCLAAGHAAVATRLLDDTHVSETQSKRWSSANAGEQLLVGNPDALGFPERST